MKTAASLLAAVVAMAMAATPSRDQSLTASPEATAPHPSTLIKEPGFKEAWAAALKGEKLDQRDAWIATLSGPGSGAIYTDGVGKQWLEGNSCQQHHCSDNHIVILVDPQTKKIWAAQRTRGALKSSQRFFGKPDAAMRKLLVNRLLENFR